MYLRSTAVKVALLCVAVCHSVAAAEIKIVGPTTVPSRGLVLLKIEGVKLGDPFDVFVTPSAATLVLLFNADGSPVGVFQAENDGLYTAIAVRYDEESKKILRTLHPLTAGTPTPGPAPGPGPGPTPGPTPPPDPSGPLAKQMASWLAPLKGTVTKEQLLDMGAVYEAIAAEAVATQGTMTKDGFVAATQVQTVRVLGPQTALAMRDPFAIPLAKYMNAKKLAADDEAGHAALWREVGAALTEVSKSW